MLRASKSEMHNCKYPVYRDKHSYTIRQLFTHGIMNEKWYKVLSDLQKPSTEVLNRPKYSTDKPIPVIQLDVVQQKLTC